MATPRKKPEDLLKRGRPTIYTDDLPQRLRDYFDVPANEIEESFDELGGIRKKVVANVMPTLAGFCCMVKIHRDTLVEWAKKYPDFSVAVKEAKDHQERILVENGLAGATPPAMTIFILKNLAGYRDQQSIEHSGPEGGEIKTSLIIKFETPPGSK